MRKTMSLAKVLLAIATAFLIMLPLLYISQVTAGADETSTSLTNTGDGYVFFVVDEGQVPLAAVPTTHHSVNPIPLFVCFAAVSIVLFIYCMYCLTMTHNANVMAEKLPVFMRSELRNCNAFLHPLRVKSAIKDAEYCVTFKYINY